MRLRSGSGARAKCRLHLVPSASYGAATFGSIRRRARCLRRSINQTAVSCRSSAIDYINDFTAKTTGTDEDDSKALLDSMLFEIFFDKTGTPRDQPKFHRFNEVFDPQRFAAFKPSFDFIAACRRPYVGRYYAIPDKGH